MAKKIFFLLPVLIFTLSAYSDTTPCNLTDEGVLINGIQWATRNVDMPGTFAETPESFGMLFQWNRKKAWNAVDKYVEGWDSSIPEGTKWYAENDPCPEGWRIPTRSELDQLRSINSELASKNGVNGRLFGIEPHQFFLPATGGRSGNSENLVGIGAFGFFWSNTRRDAINAMGFAFNNNYVLAHLFWRQNNATSIRCVAK